MLKILNLSLNSLPFKKKFLFICKKINFHSIFDLSLIFYRLQLPCLDQIEEDFRIITLHFLFTLLLVKLEQLINEPGCVNKFWTSFILQYIDLASR